MNAITQTAYVVSDKSAVLSVHSQFDAAQRVLPHTLPRRFRVTQSGKTDLLLLDATTTRVESVLEKAYELRATVSPDCVLLVTGEASLPEATEAVAMGWVDRVLLANSAERDWRSQFSTISDYIDRLRETRRRSEGYIPDNIFMTGATGFLGKIFLRHLLACTESHITLLTRASREEAHDERLPVYAAQYPDRLSYVEGDIRMPGFGLNVETLGQLRDSVDEVWHLAASTRFEESLRTKTMAVNVGGTQNLLAFARDLPLLQCVNHVSTAFVSGIQPAGAIVPETMLPRPEHFRNPYEESKYEAEGLVAQSGLPHIIYRPGIVLGDTLSGRSDGQTIYNIAKMVRLAKLLRDRDCRRRSLPANHHSFRVVADTHATKNLLPADYVAAMMLGIRAKAGPAEGVYHVTHSQPTLIAEIVSAITRLLNTANYEIVSGLEGETLSIPERAMERVASIFRPYMLNSDPVFDMTHTRAALGDLCLPHIDSDFLAWAIDAFYTQQFGIDYALEPAYA